LAGAVSPRTHRCVWICKTLLSGLLAVAVANSFSQPRPQEPSTIDTSCHNPFRDRTKSAVSPKEDIDLGVEEEQWPDLTNLLIEFARQHGWSLRDTSLTIPDRLTNINVSLCAESSLRILVLENHWKTTHAHDHPGRFTPVTLYGDVAPEVWQPIARDLVRDLEAKWPGKVRFVDRDGKIRNDRPSYLIKTK
jgi:hypothetical protein